MGILDQVVAQSLMRSTPGAAAGAQRYYEQQEAGLRRQETERLRGLRGEMRENIESGASLLGQSNLISQLAVDKPDEAARLQGLFSGISKQQMTDALMSVPIAASMSYDNGTKFWENKKQEYANNPNVINQIEGIISAGPDERGSIYHGLMTLGSDMGMYGEKPAQEKPLQKSAEGLVFNPNTGDFSIDPIYAENKKQINKMALEQKKKEKDLEVETAKSKARIQGLAEREKADIDNGLMAVRSMPTLKRIDKLLDIVDTGKPAQAMLWAKKWLGKEPANASELNNLMGKQVLSQLKDIFGSQFTAGEGQLLMDMEANFGKSTEGNRALIRQAKLAIDERARIGKEAAQAAGDQRIVDNFDSWANWEFSDNVKTELTTEQKEASEAEIMSKYGL